MFKTPRWLTDLGISIYRMYFRYIPRFDEGLFHYRAEQKDMRLLLPYDSCVIKQDDYLVRAEMFIFFGFAYIIKVQATYQAPQ